MRSISAFVALACTVAGAVAGSAAALATSRQTSSLEVSSTTAALTFSPAHVHHGFGGLSAGASSRLLWDYPEQQREELLDYLFKPNFGAALTINKVEIGGSVPSTDGAEPAIEPTGPGSLDCSRLSYEGWLMVESAKRNPNMKQYALSWGVPGWVGNGTYYSDENVQFHMDWMNCAKNTYSVNIDYIGVWNERSVGAVGMDWAVKLRRALDANGYQETQIIVPDGAHLKPELLELLQTNTTMRDAVFGIGLHYPCNQPSQPVQDLGLAYWASEDYSSDAATWATGGDVWGRLLVQNYLEMNMTGTIAWATIWSVYPNLVCQHNGLTRAMEPWSGHYEVDSPIWASAHLGQFVQPGWWYLGASEGGGSGWLAGGGGYVTLVDSNTTATQFVTVIYTLSQGKCNLRPASAPQNLTLTLASGFPRPASGGASLWRTTENDLFELVQSNITAVEHADGTATITLPTLLTDALYTLTSHPQGQTKGNTSVPPSQPFPMPFTDNFEAPGAAGTKNKFMPAYWADQYGLFELHTATGPAREPNSAEAPATTTVLQQMVLENPGVSGWAHNRNPLTILGDVTWEDYSVSVDAFLNTSATSLEGGTVAVELAPCATDPESTTARFQHFVNNTPVPRYLYNSGTRTCLNQNGCGGAGTQVIVYTCITDSNTCSGPPPAGQPVNTLNLQWELTEDGALHNMVNDLCVSPTPPAELPARLLQAPALAQKAGPPSLSMQECASPIQPAQQWSLNASTGQLKHAGTGLCMQLPTPQRYVEVCGRIGTLNGFAGWKDAYCLRSNESDWWMTVETQSGQTVLADGQVPAGAWEPAQGGGWIKLGMVFAGDTISSVVGGQTVSRVTDSASLAGMVGIGSGFHGAMFDNFFVSG